MFPGNTEIIELGGRWKAELKREITGADLERFWAEDGAANDRFLPIELHLIRVIDPNGIEHPASHDMIRQMPLSWLLILMREAAERTSPLAEAVQIGERTTGLEASQTERPGGS